MTRQAIEKRKFDSRTSSATYEAVRYDDGSFSCDCRGWTMKKKGWARYCSHTGQIGDYKVMDTTGERRVVVVAQPQAFPLSDRSMFATADRIYYSGPFVPVRDLMVKPPKPSEPSRAKNIVQPDRARIAFDEEV